MLISVALAICSVVTSAKGGYEIPDVCLVMSFFQDITHPSSSLYHLFPPPRDTSVLSRLRTATRFQRPVSLTKNIAPLLITP